MNFVRIIPNSLWEELLKHAYPCSHPSKKEDLLSKFPQTLHHSITKLLDKIDWNDKHELVSMHKAIPHSNVVDLITKYILKSKHFHSLPGSEVFKQLVGSKCSWITFEERYGKVHQTSISKGKCSRGIQRSGRVLKKQSTLQRQQKSAADPSRTENFFTSQTGSPAVS